MPLSPVGTRDDFGLTPAPIMAVMPTLAELLLSLITDQPLSADEKREVALHVLQLVRWVRDSQSASGMHARNLAVEGPPTPDQPHTSQS